MIHSDKSLFAWLENAKPTIYPVFKPDEDGAPSIFSHWDVDMGIMSFCAPDIQSAICGAMMGGFETTP
jgi:hypothetical protein